MSSNQVPPPRLPEAPPEYSVGYMSDLIRALEIFIEQERNPGGYSCLHCNINRFTDKRHWT